KTLILTSVNDLSKINPEEFKQLTTIQISKEALIENSNVDLSGLPSTVKTFIISENSSVKSLSVKNNSLTKVEAEKCVALESVDISGNTTIETINIKGSGSVTVFKANDCTNLKYIDCSECNLSDFDINNSVNLVSVDCSHNRLLTLDLPEGTFTKLGSLNCISQELGNWRSTVKLNFDTFVKSPDLSVDVTISASEINGIKTSDLSKVTNLTAYDANGNLISYSFDNDGNITFDSKPDKFMYNYNTGFKNQIMDVTVYAADENSMTDSGSGCGGCNSAFGMLSLSALGLLIFVKPTKRK
ncbi:MAG: leucine-rich repeat domain-containing protein, partial [Synergistaceae bacterium]|nr:leucine-rich repeat domain-containing protein [Synergistaceae bacterium]